MIQKYVNEKFKENEEKKLWKDKKKNVFIKRGTFFYKKLFLFFMWMILIKKRGTFFLLKIFFLISGILIKCVLTCKKPVPVSPYHTTDNFSS